MTDVSTSELRIPADPSYIVVAKRAVAGFGCVAGFGVEAIDDLVIAVAQACQSAISVDWCMPSDSRWSWPPAANAPTTTGCGSPAST